MKKITVKGAYGATNFGDDLLMCLFEEYFTSRFSCIILNFEGMYDNDYPASLLKFSGYNLKNFEEHWLVYGGGTQFFAYSRKGNRLIFFFKLFFSKPSEFFKKIFMFFKKKLSSNSLTNLEINRNCSVAFLGFGLGPFESSEIIPKVQGILKNARFVGVRDIVSKKYCDDWKIENSLGADIAFSSHFKFNIDEISGLRPGKKKIGIVVRDWVWEESGQGYFSPIINLYKSSVFSEIYDFQFIVFAPFKDPFWMDKLKNEEVLVWDPNIHTIEGFLNLLNHFDGFISARFHGAIIGAILGKPVIAIEIEPKLAILASEIEEFQLWKKPFVVSELHYLLDTLNFNVDYSKSLARLKERADKGLDDFFKFYSENC